MLPIAGTAAARIGKGGRTDADGRFLASLVVGIALSAVLVEATGIALAARVFDRSALDGDVLLLASPLVCLSACLIGIRWVFPLNQLASVRTFVDVGAFVAACGVVVWVVSKFRGWGILFLGDVMQIGLFAVLGIALLRRLYRRAFGRVAPRVEVP